MMNPLPLSALSKSVAPLRFPSFVMALAMFFSGSLAVRAENITAETPQIRMEYAQVLRVEPVYQTLRAYAIEEQCDPPPAAAVDDRPLGQMLGSLKVSLADRADTRKTDKKADKAGGQDRAAKGQHCRQVRVPREFRRPIAYDVDYIHRGVNYRARLPFDPGKRLRVRVSVTPDLSYKN